MHKKERKQEHSGILRRMWHFIWYDESALSWAVNFILAFILIKFIFYPGLGMILGTSLPAVAVISGSMDHSVQQGMLCGERVSEQAVFWDVCGSWYEERGITYEQFLEFPFARGFSKGDIMLVRGVTKETANIGDVIIFQSNKAYPIIHRIVAIDEYITAKGDHNEAPIEQYVLLQGNFAYECYVQQGETRILASCLDVNAQRVDFQTPGAVALLDETRITDEQLIGKAFARIPYLGYIRILFGELLARLGIGSL